MKPQLFVKRQGEGFAVSALLNENFSEATATNGRVCGSYKELIEYLRLWGVSNMPAQNAEEAVVECENWLIMH